MSKPKQIGIIILVCAIFVCGGIVCILCGTRLTSSNYVCVEVNPRLEFICNRKNIVTSLKPINEQAKELIINEDFVGLKVDDAVVKFVDLCAKANYIDVDSTDNAIKLTILSGFTQALETTIIEDVFDYLINNEIYSTVIESANDLTAYKESKKYGTSLERYDLMQAVIENDNSITMKDLRRYTIVQLIDKIKEQHSNYDLQFDETELNDKTLLIDFNRVKYNEHIENITTDTTKEFKEKYVEFLASKTKGYEVDFLGSYTKWLDSHTI